MYKLQGDEIPLPDEMRAQAFWLVRKYTSFAYIERMARLYASFVRGYAEYAGTEPPETEASFFRESLATLRRYGENFDAGLDLFGREKRARVEMALGAQCAFPDIIQGPRKPRCLPNKIEPLPEPTGLRLENGQEVPVTGIWIPLDIPRGCPNFFRMGGSAYPGLRLATRIYCPPYGNKDKVYPEKTIYEYERTPTRWELVWEDRRYQGGALPDESAYLDGDDLAAFPPVKPQHAP